MTPEEIARVAYEVNRAHLQAHGDHQARPWDQASGDERDAYRSAVTYYLERPNAQPWQAHEHWCEQMTRNGWTCAAVRDNEQRTHPRLLPFGLLDASMRAPYYLFRAIVTELQDAPCRH